MLPSRKPLFSLWSHRFLFRPSTEYKLGTAQPSKAIWCLVFFTSDSMAHGGVLGTVSKSNCSWSVWEPGEHWKPCSPVQILSRDGPQETDSDSSGTSKDGEYPLCRCLQILPRRRLGLSYECGITCKNSCLATESINSSVSAMNEKMAHKLSLWNLGGIISHLIAVALERICSWGPHNNWPTANLLWLI